MGSAAHRCGHVGGGPARDAHRRRLVVAAELRGRGDPRRRRRGAAGAAGAVAGSGREPGRLPYLGYRTSVSSRPAAPTLDALVEIHRRHLEQVPYENLSIMLGRPPSVDGDDCLRRVGEVGRAGYCFHQNGAVEIVLRDLGYDVSRRHGQVWTKPEELETPSLNHLVLVVSGLPTEANPGGDWWFDVGLGDGFHEPLAPRRGPPPARRRDLPPRGRAPGRLDLPPRPGRHLHRGRRDVGADRSRPRSWPRTPSCPRRPARSPGWSSSSGSARPASTPSGAACGRGRGPRPCCPTSPTWRSALVDLGLSLDGIDDAELEPLFDRMWAGHLAWDAAGSSLGWGHVRLRRAARDRR